MNDSIEQQIQYGMQQQLQQWREDLKTGSQRLGWKVGFNRECDQQKASLPSLQIGYLLKDRSYLQQGQHHVDGGSLLVEGEIAIQMANSLPKNATIDQAEESIGSYAAALELVDIKRTLGSDIQSMLISNLVHESVLLGTDITNKLNTHKLNGHLTINGQQASELDSSRTPESFAPLLCQVANTLAEYGEQLQAGDWIITGAATTPVKVKLGDVIQFKLDGFSEIILSIT